MQSSWSWLRTGGVVAAATLALLVLAEGILRFSVTSAPSYINYAFYANRLGDLPPQVDLVDNLIKGLPYHVSSDTEGFRSSPEVPPASPRPRVVRILCLGDSFTFGIGVDDTQTFPTLLRRYLEDRYPDIRFDVFNSGIPFYDIVDELDYWEQKGQALRPDIVVCQFFYNDIQTMQGTSFRRTRRFPPKDYDRVSDTVHNLRLVQMASALSYKLGLAPTVATVPSSKEDPWYGRYCPPLSEPQAAVISTTARILDQRLLPMVSCRFDAYFRNLLELQRKVAATGAQLLFINLPDRSQILDNLFAPSAYLNTRLEAAGIGFIDFFPVFRTIYHRHRVEPYNIPYDFHLNSTGNTLVAHKLSQVIQIGEDGKIMLAPPRNCPYDAVQDVALVFDGRNITTAEGQSPLAVQCQTDGLDFQGAGSDRPTVEATVHGDRPGELTLTLRPPRDIRYVGIRMHPLITNDLKNGGLKGFVTYAKDQSETLIDRDRETMIDSAYFFEHFDPDGGIREVTLRFVIGQSTALVFGKQGTAAQNLFVFSYQ